MNRLPALIQLLRRITAALSIALLAVPVPAFATPSPMIAAPILLLPGNLGAGIVAPEWFLLAQSTDEPSDYESHADRNPQPKLAIAASETRRIIKLISDGRDFCSGVPLLYRVDCLRYHFWKVAQTLPKTGDYAPVRAALLNAADQLEAIRDANLDPAGKPTQFRLRSKPDAARVPALVPIRPASAAQANSAATEVIAQTTTILLRSTENSDRRQASYQEIAAVIDSTKVLLRSA